MPEIATQHHQERLQLLTETLESGALANVRQMLHSLHPAEIAHLLESLPVYERELVWSAISSDHEGDVLTHVSDDVRSALIDEMDTQKLVAATEGLATDDLADILQQLPEAVIQEVLQSMDVQDRHRLETVMSYPEDTAGGLMNTDTVTVRSDVTLEVVMRYLRQRGELPDTTDKLIVVDRNDAYLGVLPLSDLLTQSPTKQVASVMKRDVQALPVNTPVSKITHLFEHRDLISAPVVDEHGKLLGRITIDDVVDEIRDSTEHSMLGMSGLDENEDMFAPVLVSARHRAVWLGLNLLTAFLASWVIGLFETTIDKIVALAVLMPIVASMGGIAGSQTLTLVIRGMAVGQVGFANASHVFTKELGVGFINGVLWAIVVAAITWLWFDPQIGMIIAAAIIINMVIAAVAGVMIPLLLKKFGADPALGGSVMLTTVTDVIGFMAFLGLATLVLL
ncbi:MAG TPA: magnesium transporter [Gammaproteobacteria bacterium]|nr:magnesium transporter [Gammaproteobacteria bacterium]